jgi:hypothetical protein
MKQEWRVKEKTSVPTLTACDDDMDLLDDDESPLIKGGSPPPIGMDVNMVFTLPAEFRGVEEEITQLCLGPKEVMFEKPEESSQHLKPLYVQRHIDGRPISKMLVNDSTTVNLMPYSVFKKLRREDDELVKINLTLNGVGCNPMEVRGVVSIELTVGSKSLATTFFVVEVQGNYSVILSRDWIHSNHYVPSTMQQFLIQRIDDEIEVVHTDASTYIALIDAMTNCSMGVPSACQERIF